MTAFEFALHPQGPEVASALVLYPREDAEAVLRAFRDHAAEAPEEVTPEVGLWSIPPLPDLPEDLHGRPVVVVAGLFAGPPEAAAPALAPLAELGAPLADLGGTSTYVESQSALDDLFPDGGRYYWKSHFLDRMSDAAIAAMLECDARRPNPESVILIRTLGGAVRRVGEGESSFAHRSAAFNLSVDAIWSDPALDEAAIGWARSTWGALAPHATGGVYLNFAGLGEREDDVMSAAIGASEARLARIRRAYDPEGVFEAAAARP